MVTGAPFQTQPVDLCRFFDGFDLDLPNAFYFERCVARLVTRWADAYAAIPCWASRVAFCHVCDGRSPNNDVVVRFKSQSEAQRAMREKNMRPLLSRFVRVFALS